MNNFLPIRMMTSPNRRIPEIVQVKAACQKRKARRGNYSLKYATFPKASELSGGRFGGQATCIVQTGNPNLAEME